MIELDGAELALEQERFTDLAPTTEALIEHHLKETVRPDDFKENPDRSRLSYKTREPVDWRAIGESTFGLPRDVSAVDLFRVVRRSHDLWLPYLQERFPEKLSPETLADMKRVRDASYVVGTLTEDNLPGYKEVMHIVFSRAPKEVREVFLRGLGLWTSEEDGHGQALAAYGEWTDLFTGEKVLPGWRYKPSRTNQLVHGSSEVPGLVIPLKVYTGQQEPMANIAHTKDAALHDPFGHALLMAIAADEARHGWWFGKEVQAQVEKYGEDIIDAFYWSIFDEDGKPNAFQMPGSDGIYQYGKLSTVISAGNLLTRQDYFDVLLKVAGQWQIRNIVPKTEKGKKQQEMIVGLLDFVKAQEKKELKMRPGKFVLEQTLETSELDEARDDYPAYLEAA